MNIIIEVHAKLDGNYPDVPLIKFDSVETFENNQLSSIIEPINFISENSKQLNENEGFVKFILLPDKENTTEGFQVEVTMKQLWNDFSMTAFREFKSFLKLYFQGAFKELLMASLTTQKYTLISK